MCDLVKVFASLFGFVIIMFVCLRVWEWVWFKINWGRRYKLYERTGRYE